MVVSAAHQVLCKHARAPKKPLTGEVKGRAGGVELPQQNHSRAKWKKKADEMGLIIWAHSLGGVMRLCAPLWQSAAASKKLLPARIPEAKVAKTHV